MQPSLFQSKAPRVNEADVRFVISALTGQGWIRAKDFGNGYSDRELRAIAAMSLGRIISGQKGYRTIEDATVDEANHAASWLERQGQLMIRRAKEIRQAMHRRTHAA